MSDPRAITKQWLRSGSDAVQRRFAGPGEPTGAYGRPKIFPEPTGVACRLEVLERSRPWPELRRPPWDGVGAGNGVDAGRRTWSGRF